MSITSCRVCCLKIKKKRCKTFTDVASLDEYLEKLIVVLPSPFIETHEYSRAVPAKICCSCINQIDAFYALLLNCAEKNCLFLSLTDAYKPKRIDHVASHSKKLKNKNTKKH